MADVDVVVVGAGVVGLAVARALALQGRSVVVLEAADGIGSETSSRNSEVIHAGLYYPAGSLKARLCVEGRERLYAFCASHGVPHRRCGKLVVAADATELAAVEAVGRRGAQNGVDDLEMISGAAARALEPSLACVGALLSPSTGIIDSHAYMLALLGDAEAHGAAFAFRTPFLRAEATGGGFTVEAGGAEPMRLTCGALVNCGGLHASRVAAAVAGLAGEHVPQTRYAKGNYFVLAGRAPFSRLIYPAPHAHGLGVHLTLDLGGQAKFGPDVEWVDAIDYEVDPARGEGFEAAIRCYWPGLPDGALAPGYSGIRPKIAGPHDPAPDFRVDGPEAHGVAGLVNLFGIESPGLTASLALADEVTRRLG
ncbi:NAD(P)/FAD-dependent oxidoreductase [Alsobacter sp. SYSU M60028]|uniref:NAD(P)/FAD-dependent oxidoreductase n=1 Tax=Alsobacter ponti TaxID=2962936 RepID=A0ABT1L8T4_9HYPH|nr:NAD(P)/FAD-dependent oxidoreductase [Alsobacter ponti]MCP8937906.1 NAD(P)/FAD-dependent oxidoreductase [Alsobacter ponti]